MEQARIGYASVHYIASLKGSRTSSPEYSRFQNIKFEVQIRSILQHTWAEIEHDLQYKSQESLPRELRRKFARLAGLGARPLWFFVVMLLPESRTTQRERRCRPGRRSWPMCGPRARNWASRSAAGTRKSPKASTARFWSVRCSSHDSSVRSPVPNSEQGLLSSACGPDP